MTDSRAAFDALVVGVIAVALRATSLLVSPLPFNPDGFSHVRVAEALLSTGQFPLSSMATDQIGYASLVAAAASLTGRPPLLVIQPLSVLVGGAIPVVGLAYARAVTTELDWSRRRVRTSGLLAGFLLAVGGVVFLYRTMAADEQTLGLLLVALLGLALYRALTTRRPVWALATALLVAVLPPTHNLSGVVGALVVTTLVTSLATGRWEARPIGVAGTAAVTCGTWGYTIGYHVALTWLTPTRIVQTDRLVDAPGVFLAWIVLVLLGLAWYTRTTTRIQRAVATSVPIGAFGLLTVNAALAVYPGTTTTPRVLLVAMAPLFVPAALAGYAVPWATGRAAPAGAAILALLGGPLVLIGTALTAGLTFEYLSMLYRAALFVHLPLAVLAAAGTVAVASRRRVRTVAAVALILCAAVSAPLALSGLSVLTFKGATTPAEFEATAFASTSVDGQWATDDHLARVASYHGGSAAEGPVREWLALGGMPPRCPTLAQRSWTTTGAQFYPRPPPTVDLAAFERWTDGNNVVYATTSADPLIVVVPAGAGNATCRP